MSSAPLRRLWESGADREAVRAFHAQCRNGVRPSSVPGFRKAIRELLNVHGYSMQDVAVMFGVTRQCIGQVANRDHIRPVTKYGWYRVWDDEMTRFRPASRAEVMEIERRVRVMAREDQRRAKRQQDVDALRALTIELDRSPTFKELTKRLGAIASITKRWGRGKDDRTYRQAFDALFAAAGITHRRRQGEHLTEASHA